MTLCTVQETMGQLWGTLHLLLKILPSRPHTPQGQWLCYWGRGGKLGFEGNWWCGWRQRPRTQPPTDPEEWQALPSPSHMSSLCRNSWCATPGTHTDRSSPQAACLLCQQQRALALVLLLTFALQSACLPRTGCRRCQGKVQSNSPHTYPSSEALLGGEPGLLGMEG